MFSFSGIVKAGNKRGRDLGFPTANVPLSQSIPEGIYASKVIIDKKPHHAITFIGAAKTFDETVYQSETYVLDFDEDLYGKEIVISLLKKIRGNMKFSSVKDLIAQMKVDERDARKYFATTL